MTMIFFPASFVAVSALTARDVVLCRTRIQCAFAVCVWDEPHRTGGWYIWHGAAVLGGDHPVDAIHGVGHGRTSQARVSQPRFGESFADT